MKLLDQIIQQASTRELQEIIRRCNVEQTERKSKFKYTLKKFQTDFDITTGNTPLPDIPKEEIKLNYCKFKHYSKIKDMRKLHYGYELFTNDPEFKDIETVTIIE